MTKLTTDVVVVLLLVVISAIVLIPFEGSIKEAYAEATAKQTCKASVKTHSLLKLKYADFSGEIKCPTTKLKIEDKNEDAAKKKLADAMYACWDQFGRGKADLFADDSVYCSICHKITFGKDVKINGFAQYLAENNAPNEKISYLQFLTTEQTQNSEFLNSLQSQRIESSIDASKNNEYTIVFTYIKGKKYLEEYAEKAKYASYGLGTIAVGFGFVKAGATIGFTGIGAPIALPITSFGGFLMSVGALWTGLAAYLTTIPFEYIASISLIPYDAQSIQSLNCKEIPIKQQ